MAVCRKPVDPRRCTKRAEDYGPPRGRGVVGRDAAGAVAAADDRPAPYADGQTTDGVKREARSTSRALPFFAISIRGAPLPRALHSLKRQNTSKVP